MDETYFTFGNIPQVFFFGLRQGWQIFLWVRTQVSDNFRASLFAGVQKPEFEKRHISYHCNHVLAALTRWRSAQLLAWPAP